MPAKEIVAEEGVGAVAPKVVARFGVQGVDFVNIWHSPEAPFENIKAGRGDKFLSFSNGLLVTLTPAQEMIVQRAAEGNKRYIPMDPDLTEPFECEMATCHTPWYSKAAFSRHMKFKHTGSTTRR